jgi:hypothetical protein
MAIPETGFINNVNLVADKLETIETAASLFDSATVDILNEIAALDIAAVVTDLQKSNYLGNRKLDINLDLNNLSTTSSVTYSQANLVLKDGTSLSIPFQVQLVDLSYVTEELSSHADIKNYIENSSEFTDSVTNTELTVEDVVGTSPQVIRFRDADGSSSNLDRVEYSDGTAQYTWADTTSSLQTLANRAADIIVLGESIDSIVVLSTMPDEINSLHTNIVALQALYTDLTEVMTVYSNLAAVVAVGNSIASVNTVNVNIVDILSITTDIIPNLAEILQADSNAVAAALSQTQSANSAATASTQATNAATSATTALGYLDQFADLSAITSTLVAGSSASASYNSSTGVLTLGIPQGIKGDTGEAFSVDAFGLFSSRSTYDAQSLGFSFLAVDTSTLYFKQSNTSADWTSGTLFGKGDQGDIGPIGFSWLSGAGVPSDALGVNSDLYLNQSNGDVYTKVAGTWGSSITNLSAGIDDASVSTALAWSSNKVTNELALKSNTTHNHTGTYEPLNANIQNHIVDTTNPHAVTKTQVGLGNVDNTSNATERAATATLSGKTISAATSTITTAASGNLVATELNAALAELQTDIDTKVATTDKDASGGVVGMTLFKINFKNLANTFTSKFVNSNTAARDYTFPDRTGTIADNTDLALKANLASPVFTGTPALPTGTTGITKAPGSSTTALATTAFVTTADNLKAELAGSISQAFSASTFTGAGTGLTGTAAALSISGNALTATNTTTQAASDNSTKIASTAYADAAALAGGVMTGTVTLKGITETQLTKSASFTPDFADGTVYSCTGAMTITMPTATAGKSFTIFHATGNDITWAGTIKWSNGLAPTAAAGIEIYVFISDGTNWYGMLTGTGFA